MLCTVVSKGKRRKEGWGCSHHLLASSASVALCSEVLEVGKGRLVAYMEEARRRTRS